MLQLLSMKRVQSFRVIREEETHLMLKKIEESCECSSLIDLSEVIASLTNDIVCRVAFGRKYSEGEGGKKFKKLLEEFGELLGVFNVGDFIPWLGWLNYVTGLEARVEKVFWEFDDFLDGIVDEHTKKKVATTEDQKDFVDVLLEIQKDSKSGDSVDRDGIKAIILVRILALFLHFIFLNSLERFFPVNYGDDFHRNFQKKQKILRSNLKMFCNLFQLNVSEKERNRKIIFCKRIGIGI